MICMKQGSIWIRTFVRTYLRAFEVITYFIYVHLAYYEGNYYCLYYSFIRSSLLFINMMSPIKLLRDKSYLRMEYLRRECARVRVRSPTSK